MADPRLYQIATLACLLVYGMGWLDFDITVGRAALLLATVLATQAAGDRFERRAPNWKSALISGISLCLLLRTNDALLAFLAATVTIASKFIFRCRGKHLFNPTNGGIVAMLLLTDQVWVSPGQWGSVAIFALLMARRGGLVVNRAARSDVTFAFITAYCLLLFGRSVYLGEPMTIPSHRLQSGALLLFHVLHDLGPQDHTRFARGAGAVRGPGRLRRVVRAVPAVQDQRPALVAGGVLVDRSVDRPAAARSPLFMGIKASPGEQA